MKLGFLIWHGPEFGGVQCRYARLADYIAKTRSDIEVSVIVHHEALGRVIEFIGQDSPVAVKEFGVGSYKGSLLHVIGNLIQLRKVLSALSLRQVHLCESPAYLSVLTSLATPVRTRLSLGFVDSVYKERVGRIERFFAMLSLTRFSRVDCLSQELAGTFAECYPNHSDKIGIAPCSFTDHARSSPRELRDIDVVMMARFDNGKGYELIEKIAKKISERTVHLCGFGPRSPQVLSSKVKIYKADDPFLVLGRSKIFLSIQRANNYPSQSLLEAMASGCAIIATDVGETREILDESCAVLIPYDPEALFDAIANLMADEVLRNRLGAQARKRVLGAHTIKRYADYFSDKILMH